MSKLSALFKENGADVKLEEVLEIIGNDAEDASTADMYGRYPLYYAIENDAPPDVCKVVAEACPEATSLKQLFEMKRAYAPPQDVQRILDKVPDAASKTDDPGMYPLHHAMANKATAESITVVLNAFPEAASKADMYGRYPLYYAMACKAPPDGCKVVAEACPEATLLMQLFEMKQAYASPQDVQRILDKVPEAASTADTEYGMYPLHHAMMNRATVESTTVVLNAFPEAASTADTEYGMYPLHHAMMNKAPVESTTVVLNAFPEAASKADMYGMYPLHHAMMNNATVKSTTVVLTAFPKAASTADKRGRYPLHHAMEYNAPVESTTAVLNAFPEAASKADMYGKHPLHHAMENNATVESTTAVLNAFPEAASKADQDGRYPLHHAMAKQAPVESTTVVLNAFPEAASTADQQGQYPLHHAMAKQAPVESTTAVLNAFPEAASKADQDGRYPLHHAMANQAPVESTTAVLNAFPEAASEADMYGKHPLHHAMENYAPVESTTVVLNAFPEAASTAAQKGQYPLHHAMANQAPVESTTAVLNAFPEAASEADMYGKHPLHHAMANQAPVESTTAVLNAFPEAASKADQDGRYPLHLAMAKQTPANATYAAFAAYPEAASTNDRSAHTAIYYGTDASNTQKYKPHAVMRTLLRYGCKDANFDPTDLKERYFVAAAPKEDGQTTGNADNRFGELRDLLHATPTDLAELLNTFNPSFTPPTVNAAELCKGWTPLQIAATLGTPDSFFWLLEQHEQDASFIFGDPAQLDSAAVTAARASHDSKIQAWGNMYGRLLGKYKIDSSEVPKHVSETCVVIFASELDSATGKDVPVALKFMKDKEAFQREIDNRAVVLQGRKGNSGAAVNTELLIGIRASAVLEASDLRPFPQIKLSAHQTAKGRRAANASGGTTTTEASTPSTHNLEEPLKYLLVLDKGTADLSDVISHSNMAGNNCHEALSSGLKVANCLQYLNEGCYVMHGDVKSRNFVEMGLGHSTASIDLDAAAVIDGKSFAGQKVTSSGCLPPEQAAIVLYRRRKERIAAEERQKAAEPKERRQSKIDQEVTLEELKTKYIHAFQENCEDDAIKLMAQINVLKAKMSGAATLLSTTTPPPVIASIAYDMWGFGVLMYQLCTGRALFDMDVREEVDDTELEVIATWSDDSLVKRGKLNRIDEAAGWPKTLISKLLSREPTDRPQRWSDVIRELEAVSGGSSTERAILVALQEATVERRKYADEASAERKGYAEQNAALSADLLATVKAEADAIRKFFVDYDTAKHPHVYDMMSRDDLAAEAAAIEADETGAEVDAPVALIDLFKTGSKSDIAEAQQAYKDVKKRLGRAQRFLNRAKKVFNTAVELKDDFSLEKIQEAMEANAKDKSVGVYQLRLLCGITFEPVVTYDLNDPATVKEYGPKMQKLAKVGAAIASCAIKVGTFANPLSKVAGFFGYPVPQVPVEKIAGFKEFLDEVSGKTAGPKSDAAEEYEGLKAQMSGGLDLEAMGEFGELLDRLVADDPDNDWKGKLVPWPDPNNPGMVTFIDAKQYPNHTWGDDGSAGGGNGGGDRVNGAGVVGGVVGGGGGGSGSGGGGTGDDGVSEDKKGEKSSFCLIM